MPQAAEDLAEDAVFEFLDAQELLESIQRETMLRIAYFQSGNATRTISIQRQMQRELAKLEAVARNYYATTLPRIYLAGVREAVGNSAYKLGEEDMKILTEIQRRGLQDLADAQARTLSDSRRFMQMIRSGKDPNIRPGAKRSNNLTLLDVSPKAPEEIIKATQDSILKRHGIKAVRYSDGKKYGLGDYASMSIRSNANSTYNQGLLRGFLSKKVEVVQVSDGPECGWTRHDDSDLANGTIRTIEDAMSFASAHPNCRRTFEPRPDLKKKDAEKKRRLTKGETALIASGAIAASTAAVVSVAAKLHLAEKVEARLKLAAFRGDPLAQRFIRTLNAVKGSFLNLEDLANVTQGQFRLVAENRLISPGNELGPDNPLFRKVVNGIMEDADRFSKGIDTVADRTKKAIDAAQNATRRELADRFQLFASFDRKLKNGDIPTSQLAKVLDFELKRRNLNQLRLLEDTPLGGKIIGTWTQYGARARVDLTDFLRGRLTLTPTGIIKNLTHAPIAGFRTGIRVFQDGSLGGQLSLVPKGIFRAIVEVDRDGKLVGNLRLVPKGPVKLKLEFELKGFTARGVSSFEARETVRESLEAAADRAGERALQAAQEARKLAEKVRRVPGNKVLVQEAEASLQELRNANGALRKAKDRLQTFENLKFNLEDPRLQDLFGDLRQMELKRAVIEYKIVKLGPLKISGNLRIPLDTIKQALGSAENKLSLVKQGETYSGIFRIPAPKEILDSLADLAHKNTIFGNIQFGKFTELRTRVHLDDLRLQSIASNLKVHGYNVFDIANILEMRAEDVIGLVNERVAQIENWMTRLGVRRIEDIGPAFEDRVTVAKNEIGMLAGANRQEVIQAAVDGFNSERISEPRRRLLETLAGIAEKDGQQVIEQKLWELRHYLMTDQVDRLDKGLVFRNLGQRVVDEAGNLEGWKVKEGVVNKFDPTETLGVLEKITRQDVQSLARRFTRGDIALSVNPLPQIGQRWADILEKAKLFNHSWEDTLSNLRATGRSVLFDFPRYVARYINKPFDLIDDFGQAVIKRLERAWVNFDALKNQLLNITDPTKALVTDLDQLLAEMRAVSRPEEFMHGVDTILVDPNRFPEARRAVEEAIDKVREIFPNMPPVKVLMTKQDYKDSFAWYDFYKETISLPQKFWDKENFADFEAQLVTLRGTGYFRQGSPVETIVHEIGHHMEGSIARSGSKVGFVVSPNGDIWVDDVYDRYKMGVMSEISRKFGFTDNVLSEALGINPVSGLTNYEEIRRMLQSHLGLYGTTDQWEFLAEMFLKWVQEERNGIDHGITKTLGDILLATFGPRPE